MQVAAPKSQLPLVLLIDSEPLLLRSFRRMVRLLPLRLVTAASAEEGLALIVRDGPPALVISGYHLADMDGLSLLAKVRLDHPGVRLVLSSGTYTTPLPGIGILLLPKPVDVIAFARLVDSLHRGPPSGLWRPQPTREPGDV